MLNVRNDTLVQRELKELLEYSPKTGIFIWKKRVANCIKVGDKAGHNDIHGYRVIEIKGKAYKAHRLAWLYVYGYFPGYDMDHINKNPSDNRLKNLRVVSRSCNKINTNNRRDNSSGVKGIHWSKANSKWRVEIFDRYIGLYENFDDAVAARLTEEQRCGWYLWDKNSPASQYMSKSNAAKEAKICL